MTFDWLAFRPSVTVIIHSLDISIFSDDWLRQIRHFLVFDFRPEEFTNDRFDRLGCKGADKTSRNCWN